MRPLVVPTINSNDLDAKLRLWAKASGDVVRQGELLAILESTKAAFELEAEYAGVLHCAAEPGKSYAFGATIGYLFDTADEHRRWLEAHPKKSDSHGPSYQLSRPARELVEKYGITEERLRALGRKIIRASDVEPLVRQQASVASDSAELLHPSALQGTIARVVDQSHRTIPVTYVVQRIYVDSALAALARFTEEEKIMTGLPELLVFILSRLPSKFPFFFGELLPTLDFRHSAAGSIGVTYDFGKGLFVPVIKGAARLTIGEIAKQMMSLKLKAVRQSFKSEELSGGDLSLSLNTEPDIDLVLPIILPPQTCFLALSAITAACYLGPDGELQERNMVKLAGAFDHRVINGAQAGAFLTAIKKQVEEPDPAVWMKAPEGSASSPV